MMTDYHSHILPGIDDGSKSVEMSVQMLEQMQAYGTERVVATPHFYAHRERSVANFLEKRASAYAAIRTKIPEGMTVLLGAEIAIEKGISELEGIEKLAMQGTDLILLELPYAPYANWMLEEIENLAHAFQLKPILAHVHRYLLTYHKRDYERILQADAIFQINAEAFSNYREGHFSKQLIREEFPVCFGSDAHNLTDRKPNLDLARKKMRRHPEVLQASDALVEEHRRGNL